MRKIVIILLSILSLSALAARRNAYDAESIARSFFSKHTSLIKSSRVGLSLAFESDAYMVFNSGESFVLVGGDSRLPEIIGYSDSGQFVYDSLPENMRWWLSEYDRQAKLLYEDSTKFALTPRKATSAAVKTIGPLMSSKWNQGAPYNNLCPIYDSDKRAATGCVATAAAQIMYFWKYPTKGTGSHSYSWTNSWTEQTTTLSANFGATTYDWANMVDRPKASSAQIVQNAVATLMYHCGVACEMNYASNKNSSSGAVPKKMTQALKDNFGYDSDLKTDVYRSNYSDEEFELILINEIDAGRPVLYSGWTEDGSSGHSFVCDGYNSQGLFHINWGWGGSSDGWFLSSVLNPSEQGIGGSVGKYNNYQQISIGIQPPKQYHLLKMDSMQLSATTINRNSTFAATIKAMKNYEVTSFSGSYGIALYNEEGTAMLQVLKSSSVYLFGARQSADKTLSTITIPSSVADGYYRLYVVYKNTGGEWHIMSACEAEDYVMIQVAGSQIVIYSAAEEPMLALTEPIAFDDNNAVPHTGSRLHYSISNLGGRFEGVICAYLYKGAALRGAMSEEIEFSLNKNQTKQGVITCNISSSTADGIYRVRLLYKPQNGSWTELAPTTEMNRQQFYLVEDEPTDIDIRLAGTPSFVNNSQVPYEGAVLSYSLYNAGVYNNGTIGAFVYAGNMCLDTLGIAQIEAQPKETINGSFTHDIEQSIASGTYKVKMRFMQYGSTVWEDMTPQYLNDVYFSLVEHITPDPIYVTISDSICEGEYYELGGEKYKWSNTYIWQGVAQNGADSIVTLKLTVLPAYNNSLVVEVCESELPYEFDGKLFYESGNYTANLKTNYGCDSLITLNLSIKPLDKFNMEETITIDELPYVVGDVVLLDENTTADVYVKTIVSEENCTEYVYTITVEDISTIGIKSEVMNVYPTVVTSMGIITIDYAEIVGQEVLIFDSLGKLVSNEKVSLEKTIHAPDAKGLYSLCIKLPSHVEVIKILVR